MKGSELRNFLFDLQSRFRDFRLNNAHYSLIGRIELDDSQRDLSFAELLALFEIIAGRTPTSTANSRQESLSNEKEDMYLDRISQLENSLDDKKREYQDLHQSYHQIQNELATVLAELKKQKQMKSVQTTPSKAVSAAHSSEHPSNVQRLRIMVQSLLHATQVLSRDRRELYNQLFLVLQGDKVSEKDVAKRLSKENELLDIYQEIMEISSLEDGSSPLLGKDGAISRPASRFWFVTDSFSSSTILFIVYTMAVWTAGIFTCIFASEYLVIIHQNITPNRHPPIY